LYNNYFNIYMVFSQIFTIFVIALNVSLIHKEGT
jgi:hypothetical protein